MCGIAGELGLYRDSRVDESSIPAMLSVLNHRGPDDFGVYLSPDRRAALLHTRLSVIDLAGGRQPLSNEDSTVWVSFNGEIYDYKSQREELRKRGHVFKTQSDTEVIVHGYEEYGEAFVSRLRGEFAIALYDQKKATLYLIRDRFGIKPLYYTVAPGSLIFGSEIKAIFSHSRVQPEFDRRNVYVYLCGMNLSSDTIFEGVKQVEPGCLLKVRNGQVERRRYWDISFSSLEDESQSAASGKHQNLVEEFRALLEEAVRLRLVADVDVGVYLSGGIDSGAIACLMAKLSHTRTKAFSIGFQDTSFDEASVAQGVAAHADLDFHLVRVGKGDLASHFVKSLWHAELPVPTSNGTAKFLLSKLARDHVKVVLTGEGSDELLCGYKHFKHQLLLDELRREPHNKHLRQRMKNFLNANKAVPYVAPFSDYQDYERVVRLFGNYPYTALRYWQFNKKIKMLLSRSLRREVADVDPLERLAELVHGADLRGLPSLSATQYLHFKTDLPVFLLSYLGDRQEMAHSVEGRVPFLDHKLVEFASKLPTNLKLRDGREKYILREALSNVVPDSLRQIEKRMFLAPTLSTLDLHKSGGLSQYFSRPVIEAAGLFDWKTVEFMRLMGRLSKNNSPRYVHYESGLTLILSFHVLYDLFVKNFHSHLADFCQVQPVHMRHVPATAMRA